MIIGHTFQPVCQQKNSNFLQKNSNFLQKKGSTFFVFPSKMPFLNLMTLRSCFLLFCRWESFFQKKYNYIEEEINMERHSARFIEAEELAALTGVSKAGAYKIIQQLNEELKQKGYLIVRGRVIYPYFYERFFGKDDKNASIQR